MAARTVVIRRNPVTSQESYHLAAVHPGRRRAAAYFDRYSAADQAEGGAWTCEFDLTAPRYVLRELFERGLDREVEVWADALESDFLGTIYSMTLTWPPNVYTISMDPIANSMFMRADVDADGVVDRSTVQTDQDSIDRFGTIDQVLSGGEMPSLSIADQAVSVYLAFRAISQPDADFGRAFNARQPSLNLFCRGYVHTLRRRVYNQTAATALISLTSLVRNILDAKGDFITSKFLDTNTTLVQQEYDSDRTPFDLLMEVIKVGDSANKRWLLRVEGRNCTQVVGRRARLREAAPDTKPAATT